MTSSLSEEDSSSKSSSSSSDNQPSDNLPSNNLPKVNQPTVNQEEAKIEEAPDKREHEKPHSSGGKPVKSADPSDASGQEDEVMHDDEDDHESSEQGPVKDCRKSRGGGKKFCLGMCPDSIGNQRDTCYGSIREAIEDDDSVDSFYREQMQHLDNTRFRHLIRKIYDRLRKRQIRLENCRQAGGTGSRLAARVIVQQIDRLKGWDFALRHQKAAVATQRRRQALGEEDKSKRNRRKEEACAQSVAGPSSANQLYKSKRQK